MNNNPHQKFAGTMITRFYKLLEKVAARKPRRQPIWHEGRLWPGMASDHLSPPGRQLRLLTRLHNRRR